MAAPEGNEAVKLPKRTRDLLARMDKAFIKIDRLLFRLGQQGLQRMTSSSVTELRALAQTAHNAAMIKVEREIDTLATVVTRYLDRDPLFSTDAYMASVNRIWLLNNQARRRRATGALPADMKDVLGQSRRAYVLRAEALVLQPVGAAGWVTDTDYVGVTVYMWSIADGRIYQVTNAKPAIYFGTDPRTLMRQSISDYVDVTISDLAHGAFTFNHAKEADGRLSLHRDLVVESAPWRGAEAYRALAARDWIELVDRIRSGELHPVRGATGSLAYVEPAGWGDLTVDDKQQTVSVDVVDARGASMRVEVTMRPENNSLIDNLELLDGHPKRQELLPQGLFGRARVSAGALTFFPMTFIYHHGVTLRGAQARQVHEIHLSLEALGEVEV